MPPNIVALDATYSLGRNLTGVGVYSREIMFGLARAYADTRFLYSYRPHRFLRSLRETIPGNARRRILRGVPRAMLFHALNQRVDWRAPKTVTTFHDLFVITNEYSAIDFRARFTQQAREAADRSDLIIAVSKFTAGQIEALLKVDPKRIRVVPHGVRPPAPIASAPPRENLILFVGAIQKRKNVARLVRAFERLPADWRLVLAGASQGYGAAEELQAVEASPRRVAIQVAGYVTPEELDSLYRRASIFAFPSLDEGFGMPVLEAMAHSVPVVTSSISALPEVAGDAALLVDPTDTEALSDALIRMATDESLRGQLIERGIARARRFTWESAIEKTWRVYSELF